MKTIPGPWVAEFSHTQQCFNVDTLEDSIKRNMRSFADGIPNDWVVLALMADYKDAHKACNFFRNEKGIPTVIERFAKEHLS